MMVSVSNSVKEVAGDCDERDEDDPAVEWSLEDVSVDAGGRLGVDVAAPVPTGGCDMSIVVDACTN